jgi:hypothetical protein
MSEYKQILVNEETMAKMLGISKPYLIKLRYARQVPCLKIGRSVRYDPHEVVIALEKFAVREER